MKTHACKDLPEEAQLLPVRLERLLFPRSRIVDAALIIVLSALFSWLLTGRQIIEADWGLIDDHQIFQMLGSQHRLPLGDIWDVAVDANTRSQIFRPVYYLFVAAQAAAFGDNVHLWYGMNTVLFAVSWRRSGGRCCGPWEAGSPEP